MEIYINIVRIHSTNLFLFNQDPLERPEQRCHSSGSSNHPPQPSDRQQHSQQHHKHKHTGGLGKEQKPFCQKLNIFSGGDCGSKCSGVFGDSVRDRRCFGIGSRSRKPRWVSQCWIQQQQDQVSLLLLLLLLLLGPTMLDTTTTRSG